MGVSLWDIYNPNMMLTYDLKVKFAGFLTCFSVRPITILWIDIGLPYLAHASITMRGCDAYVHDPDLTLTFDLKVKFLVLVVSLCPAHKFCLL